LSKSVFSQRCAKRWWFIGVSWSTVQIKI